MRSRCGLCRTLFDVLTARDKQCCSSVYGSRVGILIAVMSAWPSLIRRLVIIKKPHSFLPCRGVSLLLYCSVVSSTVATAIVRSSHGCYTLDQLFTSPAEQLLTYAIKDLRIQRYGLLRLRGFPAQRTGDFVRCTLNNFRRGGEGEERHI